MCLNLMRSQKKQKKTGLGNTVREVISRRVITSAVFYLIDRDNLQATLKEMELSLTGLVKDDEILRVGKLAGVQVFIAGSISELKDNFVINTKIIDCETGEIVGV